MNSTLFSESQDGTITTFLSSFEDIDSNVLHSKGDISLVFTSVPFYRQTNQAYYGLLTNQWQHPEEYQARFLRLGINLARILGLESGKSAPTLVIENDTTGINQKAMEYFYQSPISKFYKEPILVKNSTLYRSKGVYLHIYLPHFSNVNINLNIGRRRQKHWTQPQYEAYCNRNNLVSHPFSFCSDLTEQVIRSFTKPGDTVIDPFSGSNIVGAVSWDWGRDFIGTEADYHAFKAAKSRFTKSYYSSIPHKGKFYINYLKHQKVLTFVRSNPSFRISELVENTKITFSNAKTILDNLVHHKVISKNDRIYSSLI